MGNASVNEHVGRSGWMDKVRDYMADVLSLVETACALRLGHSVLAVGGPHGILL
jgi:hypothetical protein